MDDCNKLIEQLENLEIEKVNKRKSKLKSFNFQTLHLEYILLKIEDLNIEKEKLNQKRHALENEIKIENNPYLNICYLELLEIKARQYMTDTYLSIKRSTNDNINRSKILIDKIKRLKELYDFMAL